MLNCREHKLRTKKSEEKVRLLRYTWNKSFLNPLMWKWHTTIKHLIKIFLGFLIEIPEQHRRSQPIASSLHRWQAALDRLQLTSFFRSDCSCQASTTCSLCSSLCNARSSGLFSFQCS